MRVNESFPTVVVRFKTLEISVYSTKIMLFTQVCHSNLLTNEQLMLKLIFYIPKLAWIIHSIKYSCAMASLQLTTCSRTPFKTTYKK